MGVGSENRLEREFNRTEATYWTCFSLLWELWPFYFTILFTLGKGWWWKRRWHSVLCVTCPTAVHVKWDLGRCVDHIPTSLWVLWSSAKVRALGCCGTQGMRRMYKPGLNGLRVDMLVVVCCCLLLFRTLCGIEEQQEQKQEAWH